MQENNWSRWTPPNNHEKNSASYDLFSMLKWWFQIKCAFGLCAIRVSYDTDQARPISNNYMILLAHVRKKVFSMDLSNQSWKTLLHMTYLACWCDDFKYKHAFWRWAISTKYGPDQTGPISKCPRVWQVHPRKKWSPLTLLWKSIMKFQGGGMIPQDFSEPQDYIVMLVYH